MSLLGLRRFFNHCKNSWLINSDYSFRGMLMMRISIKLLKMRRVIIPKDHAVVFVLEMIAITYMHYLIFLTNNRFI